MVRTDSAGATNELRAARINFLIGFDLTETVRQAILALPEAAWRSALRPGRPSPRGRLVAETTDSLDLSGWPERPSA